MSAFFKKDMLIFWRDRKGLVLIVLMPFVLIIILGLSLKSFLNQEGLPSLSMKVALINQDDQEAGVQRFLETVDKAQLSDTLQKELLASLDFLLPLHMLEQLFDSEEIKEMVEVIPMDHQSARQAIFDEQVTAALQIPEHFTYDSLNKMLLNQGKGSELLLLAGDPSLLQVQVLEEILQRFAQTINHETALAQILKSAEKSDVQNSFTEQLGGTEYIREQAPLSSTQYYTFSMTAMFILFVASQTALRAYTEKYFHTFDRILLAGVPSLRYILGKAASAASITVVQITLLFSLSHLFFRVFAGKSFFFWLVFSGIILILSLCVGALAALLTSLNFRFSGPSASHFFGSGMIAVMSFLGGNFLPVAMLPDWVGELGQWTPNGLGLSAFLLGFQGASYEEMSPILVKLLLLSLLLICVSLVIFPRRRLGKG